MLDTIAVKALVNLISSSFNVGNCEVYEYGEDLSEFEKENCLLLVNHQSTVDVPVIMHMINSRRYLIFNSNWMLDEMFKYAPFGWVSIIRNDIFVKQGRETRNDQVALLPDKFKYSFSQLNRKWLVIFPEGGFLYKRIASSKAYAVKNNYPVLDYVTLPRFGAVEAALQSLSITTSSAGSTNPPGETYNSMQKSVRPEVAIEDRVKYIIDVTIAYPNINSPPSFIDMVMGSTISQPVYIYYRVYDLKKINLSSSYELQSWMYNIYKEKNDRLASYYSTGKFEHLESDLKEIPPKRLMQQHKYIYIGWDSILFSVIIMLLWTYVWVYYLPYQLISTVCGSWCGVTATR